jgi:menaquinone reductase, multiheme cytochrome c subunit
MKRGIVFFATGFLAALAVGWVAAPKGIYRTETQPLAFNHKVHTGEKGGMKCDDCHTLRADGTFAGIPKLATCAGCHADAIGDTKAERAFVDTYVKNNREPQWKVYWRQPENAWFPHASHVKAGGLKCERCHGDHGQSVRLPEYRVNVITGYSQDVMGRLSGRANLVRVSGMRMDDCVACHHQNKLEHSCLDCHK